MDVAAFKERYGITRKFAIPLLEYLDRERVTRRVGDSRGRACSARSRAPAGLVVALPPSRVDSLKFRMPLPMPRPISGRRFAPKIMMMMNRMIIELGYT